MEIWKNIPGYEGKYEVSDQGRVRSLDRWTEAGNGSARFMRFFAGRVLKQSYHPKGHAILKLGRVHRLVLEAFVGPCPDGMECRHLNGIPDDNRLENLRWGTSEENKADRHKHGTTARGSKHGQSKLTEAAVIDIRTQRISQRRFGKLYGVDRSTVKAVQIGETWKHIL